MINFNTNIKTAPAAEPITLDEAKLHCRIDGDDDNAYLSTLISAARQKIETDTGRALINQTWYLRMDEFSREIVVPYPPLSTVTSIKYIDSNGTLQTLASSVYTVNNYAQPGRIVEAYGQSWPATQSVPNAVTVEYVCGYGTSGVSVPAGLRQAILFLIAHWYRVREPIITGTIVADTPMAVQSLVTQYWHGYRF